MAQTDLSRLTNGGTTVMPLSWTAPAKRSDDGAFAKQDALENFHAPGQSGVALRLSPQSKIAADLRAVSFQSGLQPGVNENQHLEFSHRSGGGI